MASSRTGQPAERYSSALWTVLATNFIVQSGFGAILPLLPQFVRHRGFPLADMGAMAAAYAAVSFLGQMGAGPLADRWGRKFFMVAGGVLESLGTAGFLVHAAPWWYILCRILQGLGSAAVVPAANALVADLVPEERRGRAYGLMGAAGSAGFAVGPMLGGLAGAAWGLSAPFAIGVGLNAAATLVSLLLLPAGRPKVQRQRLAAHTVRPLLGTLWPYFWVMFAWMGLTGMYDTAWSLYMQYLGASKWVIGLSFTLFSGPLLLLQLFGGRAADRAGRRGLMVAGLALETLTVGFYVISRSAWLSIWVSVLEAAAMSLIGPALSASVMTRAPEDLHGAVQGWFQASGTLGAAVLALASGPLLVGHPNHPFILGAAVLMVTTIGAAVIWKPWRPDSQKL
jgi:DHA1 family multidrug resistance protein-like MFS transporter